MTLQDVEKQITEFDWPDEERIERIGQNGATGEHYQSEAYKKAIETGVYES